MTSEQNEMVLDTVHYDALNADIRILIKDDQGIWFVANDIGKMLDLKNMSQYMKDLPKEVYTTYPLATTGGKQNATIVSEPGFYRLIFKSRKPEAEAFVSWVTEEVLPQIRKTGHYAPTHRMPTAKENRETLSAELDVAERLGRTFSRGVQQAYLLEQDQKYCDENGIHFLPKLAIHEATLELEKAHITFDRSENTLMAARIPVADFPTVNVGELAKIYNHPKITTTLINRWLCEDGYQKRISKRKFAKTSLSKDIATEKLALTGDTKGKKYINGWKKTNELMDLLNKHVDEFLRG
jgi:prophage antirepressor-like protein